MLRGGMCNGFRQCCCGASPWQLVLIMSLFHAGCHALDGAHGHHDIKRFVLIGRKHKIVVHATTGVARAICFKICNSIPMPLFGLGSKGMQNQLDGLLHFPPPGTSSSAVGL